MNQTTLILSVFPLLVGTLVSGICADMYVYAQQLPSPPVAGSSSNSNGGSTSKSISPEQKTKMCDPTNQALRVVNTTEAHICGIPKNVKPSLSTTPLTSAPSSPSSPNQTVAAGASVTALPKQQQIATTNSNNGVSSLTGYITWATIALLGNLSNTSSSLLSVSTPSYIAPQIISVNQQQLQHQHQQPPLATTRANSTTGINGNATQTYAATSAAAAPDKLLYLGYHDTATSPAHENRDSTDNGSHDSKPNTHSSARITSDNSEEDKDTMRPTSSHIARDNGSIKKKETTSSINKVDFFPTNDGSSSKHKRSSSDTKILFPPPHIIVSNNHGSSNAGSSSHIDESSKVSSSSDFGLGIRNKVNSIIRDTLGGVRHSYFGFSLNGGF
jgi:hypothetical protein